MLYFYIVIKFKAYVNTQDWIYRDWRSMQNGLKWRNKFLFNKKFRTDYWAFSEAEPCFCQQLILFILIAGFQPIAPSILLWPFNFQGPYAAKSECCIVISLYLPTELWPCLLIWWAFRFWLVESRCCVTCDEIHCSLLLPHPLWSLKKTLDALGN